MPDCVTVPDTEIVAALKARGFTLAGVGPDRPPTEKTPSGCNTRPIHMTITWEAAGFDDNSPPSRTLINGPFAQRVQDLIKEVLRPLGINAKDAWFHFVHMGSLAGAHNPTVTVEIDLPVPMDAPPSALR
jgi:hypothetical protein